MEVENLNKKVEVKPPKQKSIISEIIEAFDIEWKLFFTFRDFYLKPDHVINSYAADKDEYSNPLKLVLISGTLYWIITSYLISWDTIAQIVGNGYAGLAESMILLIDNNAVSNEEFQNLISNFQFYASLVFKFLMQYLGIYVMLVALLQSALLYKFTREHGSNFKQIAGFLCYRASSFILLLLLLLPFGLISYWIPVILLMSISIYIEYLRKNSKFSIFQYLNVPVHIGKKYQMKTILIIFIGSGILGLISGIFFGFKILN